MQDSDEVLLEFETQARGVILEFKNFVYEYFDRLDLNNDGFLSREELLAALYDPNRTMREVSFLNFLLSRIREIADCYHEEWADRPDAISKVDLQEYFNKLLSDHPVTK